MILSHDMTNRWVVVIIVSVVVVLTLTRIIKSVVTGQAPVTLELRETQDTNKPKVVHGVLLYSHSAYLYCTVIIQVEGDVEIKVLLQSTE